MSLEKTRSKIAKLVHRLDVQKKTLTASEQEFLDTHKKLVQVRRDVREFLRTNK